MIILIIIHVRIFSYGRMALTVDPPPPTPPPPPPPFSFFSVSLIFFQPVTQSNSDHTQVNAHCERACVHLYIHTDIHIFRHRPTYEHTYIRTRDTYMYT